MKKLLDFGRKVMFYARVLSGYEERRIRNYRLQLEQRLQRAQARKAELRRIPEQAILSEVRRMVEEMRSLNEQLDKTDAAIKEYFKPIDMHAEMIVKTRLEGEDKTMKDMMDALQAEAKIEAEQISKVQQAESDQSNPSESKQQAQ